jgi:hypothetical protein
MSSPRFLFRNFEAAARKRNMHDFGLMAKGQDLSWIADNAQGFTVPSILPIGGGAYTLVDANNVPIAASLGARVYVNGLRQYGGLAFTLNGSTLTFLAPYIPASDDRILVELEGIGSPLPTPSFVSVLSLPPVAGQIFPRAALTAPGNYTLMLGSAVYVPVQPVAVYVNGLKQLAGTAYTVSGFSLVFVDPYIPLSGDTIEVIVG